MIIFKKMDLLFELKCLDFKYNVACKCTVIETWVVWTYKLSVLSISNMATMVLCNVRWKHYRNAFEGRQQVYLSWRLKSGVAIVED